MVNKKLIHQLSKLANEASRGLETCSTCTSGDCCRNNKTLIIHQKEFDDLKHLFLGKYLEKAIGSVKQYEETGFFTCPFFNEATNRCNIYEYRFKTCATFVSVSPSINCSTKQDRTIVSNQQIGDLLTDQHHKLKLYLRKLQRTPKVNLIDEIKKVVKDR